VPGVSSALTAAVPGQPLTFTFTAGEPGQPADAHFTYAIDWDGNGKVDQTVSGTSSLTLTHVYTVPGLDTVQVAVVDGAGNVSQAAATQQFSIQAIAMEPDPTDNSLTAVVIGGPAHGGNILIVAADANSTAVRVFVNRSEQTLPPAPSALGHILVYGQGATFVDEGLVSIVGPLVPVAIPAVLFAGSGKTTLTAEGSIANNVLVGGSGNDSLIGGAGRDILIGGAGADTVRAGSGGDILIGGSTAFDADPVALLALAAEWGRQDASSEQRVQHLFGGGGLNGTVLLNAQTVARDTAIDQLFGGSGDDWFWLAVGKTADRLAGYVGGEVGTFE
jgi:Ca2+-binding RTX toxin-like protein